MYPAMADRGVGRRVLAWVSANSLRVVGIVTVLLSGGVMAATVTTEFAPDGTESATAAMTTADVGAVTALMEFSTAHPAYLGAVLFGLVLVAMGEDVPLLGD